MSALPPRRRRRRRRIATEDDDAEEVAAACNQGVSMKTPQLDSIDLPATQRTRTLNRWLDSSKKDPTVKTIATCITPEEWAERRDKTAEREKDPGKTEHPRGDAEGGSDAQRETYVAREHAEPSSIL